MKTLVNVVYLIVLSTQSIIGQGFLGSNNTATIQSGILIIEQTASFSFGAPGSCPSLDFYSTNFGNDSMTLALYYDVRGAWPLMGCGTYDQIVFNPFDTSVCYLSIVTNIITYGDTVTEVDTVFMADLDTFDFCITGVDEISVNPKFLIHLISPP